jgi:diguanylate cyclase (GGDEF)-like protein/PAS domain S-box-containing protein
MSGAREPDAPLTQQRPDTDELALLQEQLETVQDRLADSVETLRAISAGEVDALMVGGLTGRERVFTLASADRPYRNFVENMSDGAATVSADGIVLYSNQALATLLTSTCQQVVGAPVAELVTHSSREALTRMIAAGGPGASFEATMLTTAGISVPVLVGSSLLTVNGEGITCLTFTDLTSERQAEAAMVHAAQHDALTGLPNRTLLTDRIERALARRANGHSVLALLFCDIDGFKNVNDAYGHQVGDDVLRAVALRITQVIRPEDTVARIGGDEFVVLCEGLPDAAAGAEVAARLRESIAEPIAVGPEEVEITVSIGVVAAAGADVSPDTLLRDSDEAMYKAKRQGPNVIELFDEQLRTSSRSRLRLLHEMRHAAVDGELRVHYQPSLDLATETLLGMEALVRWQHPTRGMVAPDHFIPFAERSGLINGIGAWVLHEACRQTAAWAADEGAVRDLYMSINVSGRQLAQGAGLVETVRSAIDESGVDPELLVLEVTESAIMDDAEVALRVVNELKELGLKIAIDDFGTGYSSLVYLKRFPVDALKIDRSFVAGLGVNSDDDAIVRSVVQLAHAFGIQVVAEGIETRAQLAILTDLGCEMGQGYLWSPARPADQLAPMLLGAGAILDPAVSG